MRVAVYARVSSDSQDVDLSISAQLRALREYAAKISKERYGMRQKCSTSAALADDLTFG